MILSLSTDVSGMIEMTPAQPCSVSTISAVSGDESAHSMATSVSWLIIISQHTLLSLSGFLSNIISQLHCYRVLIFQY